MQSSGDRFWAKVEKSDGCWEWHGSRNAKTGYGQLHHGYAHRIAWELTNGIIPERLHVLHHCDNPPCCRPDHLFLGTAADNVHDAQAKGRRPTALPRIQRRRYHRLTKDEISAAGEARRYGRSYPAIARDIGCSATGIFLALRRIGLTR